MLLPGVLTLTACATNTRDLSRQQFDELQYAFRRAICGSLVPISGKSTDDPYTRIQVKRQNARVKECPPELRRKVEP